MVDESFTSVASTGNATPMKDAPPIRYEVGDYDFDAESTSAVLAEEAPSPDVENGITTGVLSNDKELPPPVYAKSSSAAAKVPPSPAEKTMCSNGSSGESGGMVPLTVTSTKKKKNNRCLLYFTVIAALLLAGAVIGILFGTGTVEINKSSSSNEAGVASPAPSFVISFTPAPVATPTTPAPTVGSVPTTPQPVAATDPPVAPTTGPPTESPTASPSGTPVAGTVAPTTVPPTVPPTLSPSMGPVDSSSFRDLLLPIAGTIIDDPNTPQGRAFLALSETWEKDGLGAEYLPHLTQRYGVFTTAFSLTGAASLSEMAGIVQGPNECNWPIITCDAVNATTGLQQVKAVELVERPGFVKGKIPAELGLVTTIESIDFGQNAITGPIPEELYKITGLKNLFLHSNQMTGTLSESIANWPYLEKLYLGYNEFSGNIPDGLRSGSLDPALGLEIRPLKYLNLHHNKFSGTMPANLRLRMLFYIDLGFNQFTGTLPEDFGLTSARLRHMYMDHNQFGGTIPESYSTVGGNRLIEFHMHNNNFVGAVPSSWGKGNTKVLTMKVQNNNFDEDIDKDICKMDVFDSGEMVELSADCDICSCSESLCGQCYN